MSAAVHIRLSKIQITANNVPLWIICISKSVKETKILFAVKNSRPTSNRQKNSFRKQTIKWNKHYNVRVSKGKLSGEYIVYVENIVKSNPWCCLFFTYFFWGSLELLKLLIKCWSNYAFNSFKYSTNSICLFVVVHCVTLSVVFYFMAISWCFLWIIYDKLMWLSDRKVIAFLSV